ncbi:hypothetical protein [Rubritalea squalenifaciens]|nr:hypothetical protein [Rubritalea squalenifaciens]
MKKPMAKAGAYAPLREDLPLQLYTWLYFIAGLLGFMMLTWLLGKGWFWALFTGLLFMGIGNSIWISRVMAYGMKRFFTKTLMGFAIDVFRKRSVIKAAKEMIKVDEGFEHELVTVIQRESRWMVMVPLLISLAVLLLDILLPADLMYFQMAGIYFLAIGWGWMTLCRMGLLMMLPVDTE